MPKVTVWTPNGIIERDADNNELAAIEQVKQFATTPLDIQRRINDLVEVIDDDVQLRYSGEMGLISIYMDKNNLTKAVSLLRSLIGKMNAANDTDGLAAAKPIVDYLTELGMLS